MNKDRVKTRKVVLTARDFSSANVKKSSKTRWTMLWVMTDLEKRPQNQERQNPHTI